jgi:4'-phosphopantetheinyl transferase
MIKLAYCNVDALDLKASYNLLSDKRKNKVDNFRFLRDKKLSCGAYLLLRKLLNEEKIHNPQFKIGKYGKAYN